MGRRFMPIAILLPLVLLSLTSLGATHAPPPPLTVHEWGTFTSIAGPDGRAVEWLPLDGPQDLPGFVERYDPRFKSSQPGRIRMETPVLYFYSTEDTTVDVNVRFQNGAISEWYPRATVSPRVISYGQVERPGFASSATWSGVHVMPNAMTPDLPTEPAPSHYYLARDTDAAPIQVGGQQEKFLFYRGVGSVQPPIAASVQPDGSIAVKTPTGEPLGDLILFENRGGQIASQVQHIDEADATLMPPVLGNGSTPPTAELEQILIDHGLYPREAQAMVDTWRDSWFEEGARLFYLTSRPTIDQMLPLRITPAPTEIARAFVGRMELITARTEQDVRRAIDTHDRKMLATYGRFLRPIVEQIKLKDKVARQTTEP